RQSDRAEARGLHAGRVSAAVGHRDPRDAALGERRERLGRAWNRGITAELAVGEAQRSVEVEHEALGFAIQGRAFTSSLDSLFSTLIWVTSVRFSTSRNRFITGTFAGSYSRSAGPAARIASTRFAGIVARSRNSSSERFAPIRFRKSDSSAIPGSACNSFVRGLAMILSSTSGSIGTLGRPKRPIA